MVSLASWVTSEGSLLLGERLAYIWQESSKCKEQKENIKISQPKNIFSRMVKQDKRFCLTLCCSEHNNSKVVWAVLLCITSILTFKEAAYVIGYLWCDYVTGFAANIKY